MSKFRLIAGAVALMAAFAGPAQADPIDDALAATVRVVDRVVGQAPHIERPWIKPPVEYTLTQNTDYIGISDGGSGPVVWKVGVFDDPNLWTCTTAAPAGLPVTVTCDAVPWSQSGFVWKCDVMNVNASTYQTPGGAYDWLSESLREPVTVAERTAQRILERPTAIPVPPMSDVPPPPDPGTMHWGQVAGRVACDNVELETATATGANPWQSASAPFGVSGVTRFVCEARRAQGDARSPITAYDMNCLDPGVPGAG